MSIFGPPYRVHRPPFEVHHSRRGKYKLTSSKTPGVPQMVGGQLKFLKENDLRYNSRGWGGSAPENCGENVLDAIHSPPLTLYGGAGGALVLWTSCNKTVRKSPNPKGRRQHERMRLTTLLTFCLHQLQTQRGGHHQIKMISMNMWRSAGPNPKGRRHFLNNEKKGILHYDTSL